MKVGDKVKVKSWEEILKTVDNKYNCINLDKFGGRIHFDRESMYQYTSLIGTISNIDSITGNVQIKFSKDCPMHWHPCWLDLIPEELTTQIKTENYENKLQRKKSIVIRGTVPEGSITCGRKRKTSIAVGYLSNSVCIGG